jgi:hypothetical protein
MYSLSFPRSACVRGAIVTLGGNLHSTSLVVARESKDKPQIEQELICPLGWYKVFVVLKSGKLEANALYVDESEAVVFEFISVLG